jgi:hypothetical protein
MWGLFRNKGADPGGKTGRVVFNEERDHSFQALLGATPAFAINSIDSRFTGVGIRGYSKPHVLILIRWSILMGIALSQGVRDDVEMEAAVAASQVAFQRFIDGLLNGIVDASGSPTIKPEWLGNRVGEHEEAIRQFNELADGRIGLYSSIINGKTPLKNQFGTERWGNLGIVVEQVFLVAVSTADRSRLDKIRTQLLLESICVVADSIISGISNSIS